MVVDLARIVGAESVSTLEVDRLAYARDLWPRDLIRLRGGEIPAAPSCVVWPETPEEVGRVLKLAADLAVPIVPFGAGSGVAGGARPSQGGITLDLKRMRAIRSLDERNLRAEVESGILGDRLERALNQKGYTLGHFPSSIMCSTLGGWLAARSAGQMSTHYGKIEDMTLGVELVSPGRIRRSMVGPRAGAETDWNALILGSEGTFGVITAAELRIRPLPERRELRGMQFPNVEAGLAAIRLMLREGLRPAVVRLYDAFDTFAGRGHGQEDDVSLASGVGSFEAVSQRARDFIEDVQRRLPSRDLARRVGRGLVHGAVRAVLGAPMVIERASRLLPEDCLLVLGFEGQPALVAAEAQRGLEIGLAEGGKDLGAGPGEHWLKNRYNVSFKQSKAYENGAFVDTMEVAATWDRLSNLYQSVRKAIAQDAFVMAHFSHAYPEGCSIYFTFVGVAPAADPGATLERYDRIWRNALLAVHAAGGTISHHHGVGELKAEAMAREHGTGGHKLHQSLKFGFDPKGVMNPGKLGFDMHRPPRGAPRPRSKAREFPKEIGAAVGEKNFSSSGGRTTVRPPDENALAAVLRVAHTRGIKVASEQAGRFAPKSAVFVDLSRLEGVNRVSSPSLFVEVEAGVQVSRLEALLEKAGLTLGEVHPRARERSVGAGLAQNLLVRRGIAHGDLGDLCFAVRGLTAQGEPIETRPVPRSATGPELDRAFIGGHGAFGIITRATLRVSASPKERVIVTVAFKELELALTAARRILRRGLRPAAGRVFRDGRISFELVASGKELLSAQLAVQAAVTRDLGGIRLDENLDPAGGRFDAVVEASALWTQAEAMLGLMEKAAGGEAWVDFWAPEGVTLVARVVDRETRAQAVNAALEAGGRILFGHRSAELEAGTQFGQVNLDDDTKEAEPAFLDVEARVRQVIDPMGLFRESEEAP